MICTGDRNVRIGVNCAASGMYHIVVTDLERFYTRRTLDKLIQIRQLTEIELGSIPGNDQTVVQKQQVGVIDRCCL